MLGCCQRKRPPGTAPSSPLFPGIFSPAAGGPDCKTSHCPSQGQCAGIVAQHTSGSNEKLAWPSRLIQNYLTEGERGRGRELLRATVEQQQTGTVGKMLWILMDFELASEKGVFWKRGLFRKVHFLEILEK